MVMEVGRLGFRMLRASTEDPLFLFPWGQVRAPEQLVCHVAMHLHAALGHAQPHRTWPWPCVGVH